MNRKNILKSVLILLFLTLSIFISGCKDPNYVNTSYRYNDKDYKNGNFVYKDSEIKSINIDWITGDVELYPALNELELKIEEDVDFDSEDKYRVHHKLTDGVLDIRFCGNMTILRRKFNLKRLRLYIPKNVENINVETISSDIKTNMLDANKLSLTSISGDIDIKDSKINEAKIDTTSGSIMIFNSSVLENTINCVSGSMGLSYTTLPTKLDIESVSANISLYLTRVDKATIKFHKVSGKFKSNLTYTVDEDKYLFNNGSSNIYEIQTVSGRLSVLTK